MPRPPKDRHPERFERLSRLMKYLKEQLDGEDDYASLLRFLGRKHSQPWTSEISLRRWLHKEQFANATARRYLARAIDLDEALVESFLMHGEPDWETIEAKIPPIPKDYKRSERVEIITHSNKVSDIFNAVERLLEYLPLEWLIRLRDEVNSRIDLQASRLGLYRQNFERHPLILVIQDSILRSKLTTGQFINTVAQKKHQGLDSSALAAIVRGDRLPTRQELKFLSLYLKDQSDNYYSLEYLLSLLSNHSFNENFWQSSEKSQDCQHSNGVI